MSALRPPSLNPSRRRAQRGSALLLVMFLTAMLSLLIYSTIRVVANDIDLVIAQKKAFRARQLAEMGLNIAANPTVKNYDTELLVQNAGNNPALMEGESFQVKIRGEGGRFNINTLIQAAAQGERTPLERFFVFCGMTNEQADFLVDALIDWVDADSEKQIHGMEEEDYLALGFVGYPFNRPFYSLDELRAIPGFDAVTAAYPDWRDYFTIYSGGKLDLNAAEPKVIAAAMIAVNPTADATTDFPEYLKDAEEFVQTRYGPDGVEDTEDDTPYQDLATALTALGVDSTIPGAQLLFGLNDQTVHIESVGTVNDYRKRMVLILRNRNQGNPQILSREEIPVFDDSVAAPTR